jgi:hypothetical protein
MPWPGSLRPETPSRRGVFAIDLHRSSIRLDEGTTVPSSEAASPPQEVMPIESDWCGPFINHLLHGWLPEDQTEARHLARPAKSFVIHNGELHHRSASGILQRCISSVEGRTLLFDIHEGVCSHHAAPPILGRESFPAGLLLAHRWERHQGHRAFVPRLPVLRPANACAGTGVAEHSYHMAVHGLGNRSTGTLRESPRGLHHLFVAVDKFTKWVEAKPVTSITVG